MAEKRETRKDLPKREFDADLNDEMLSNREDPPIDQRDSDHVRDHIGNAKETPLDELKGGKSKSDATSKKHDSGNADNLSR